MSTWDKINHPHGAVTRGVRRVSQSAVGTYGAYLVHGLLHPTLLRPEVSAKERNEPLPGDELVARPSWATDFAIDIEAPPEDVWPWLVQIGYGRAGWYTWFPLDNDGRPSADAIVPELQQLAVGDVIPDGPRAAEGYGKWFVRILDRNRAMVLESRRDPFDGREVSPGDAGAFMHVTWVFALRPLAPDVTRLHVRVRAELVGSSWSVPLTRAARVLFGLGDNVMENTMLEGIKARAERAPPLAVGR